MKSAERERNIGNTKKVLEGWVYHIYSFNLPFFITAVYCIYQFPSHVHLKQCFVDILLRTMLLEWSIWDLFSMNRICFNFIITSHFCLKCLLLSDEINGFQPHILIIISTQLSKIWAAEMTAHEGEFEKTRWDIKKRLLNCRLHRAFEMHEVWENIDRYFFMERF